MSHPFRTSAFILAATLAGGGWAVPAWAWFEPGQPSRIATSLKLNITGLASLGDDCLFVLHQGERAPGDSHLPKQHLLCFRRLRAQSDTWHVGLATAGLPPGTRDLVRGPGSSLIANTGDGTFVRIPLALDQGQWKAGELEWLTPALGPGEVAASHTVAGRNLVLVCRDGIALVPLEPGSALPPATGKVIPLPRSQDDSGDSKGAARPSPRVAADRSGAILLLDPGAGAVYRLDAQAENPWQPVVAPGGLQRDTGIASLLPLDLAVFGDQLLVTCQEGKDKPTLVLVSAATGASGAPTFGASLPDGVPRGRHVAFSPSGHLFVGDSAQGRLSMVTNRKAMAGPENKHPAVRKAPAAARPAEEKAAAAAPGAAPGVTVAAPGGSAPNPGGSRQGGVKTDPAVAQAWSKVDETMAVALAKGMAAKNMPSLPDRPAGNLAPVVNRYIQARADLRTALAKAYHERIVQAVGQPGNGSELMGLIATMVAHAVKRDMQGL